MNPCSNFMSSQRKGPKSFGELFEGFSKALPEDTVEYAIYIIDPKLSDLGVRSRLNDILKESRESSKKYLKDYIWQQESFGLHLKRQDGLSYLYGSTGFGDSVADEWLIVWLLVGLSKKFPDSWIRVYDNDGEFLMIEAADKIPRWLTPEVSDNRVWLNTGKLLLVPVTGKSSSDSHSEDAKGLSISDALSIISSAPNSLIHDSLIQSEAFRRILDFPTAISSNNHTSLIKIPRKLSFILHRLPSSISPAIECFYLRDPISLKALQQPSTSKLRFAPEDFVTVSIRFPKVGFAQIKSQQFAVPLAWRAAIARLFGEKELSTTEIARLETGMKVTSGFELLVRDPARRNDRVVREIEILLSDVEEGEEELPTDEELKGWSQQDDDESWLDIDFTDFDRELSGTAKRGDGKAWTDKSAQENLRIVVERFEKFMSDEDAGLDGADFDKVDEVDEEDENEDDDVEFDEKRYAALVREMMGLPAEEPANSPSPQGNKIPGNERVQELNEEEEHRGNIDLEELSKAMEAELKTSGKLSLDAPSERTRGKQKAVDVEEEDMDEMSDNNDVDIDFNLAQNLLESLKGQVGASGPAGNLMGLMGVAMPRDEPGGKK